MKVPEQYRIKKGIFASDSSYGCNGAFEVPHYRIKGYKINCIASDGSGWQHVSITVVGDHQSKASRCPTWEEMCFVKDLFWEKEETVIQYHPPESEYVNNHPYCLHLWKPDNVVLPLPDSMMVGLKTLNT